MTTHTEPTATTPGRTLAEFHIDGIGESTITVLRLDHDFTDGPFAVRFTGHEVPGWTDVPDGCTVHRQTVFGDLVLCPDADAAMAHAVDRAGWTPADLAAAVR
jgi:hypothetical protein